jgi:hypothetical protein
VQSDLCGVVLDEVREVVLKKILMQNYDIAKFFVWNPKVVCIVISGPFH